MSAKTASAPAAQAGKRVLIELPRTKGQSPVEVAVSGEWKTVKRGTRVEVPRSIAEILMRREEYAMKAMDYEESRQQRDA